MEKSRYLRDLRDGIIVIAQKGTIVEMNESARSLLGLERDFVGEKYSELFIADENEKNDDLHQMVIEAVMEPEALHSQKINYYGKNGEEKVFQVNSSYTREDESGPCVILSFTDITELGTLLRQRKTASAAFMCITGYLCVWLFAVAVWEYTGRPIADYVMSKVLIYGSFLLALYCKFSLKLSNDETGLKVKGIRKSIITDSIIAVVGVLLLIGGKAVILKLFPAFSFYTKDGAFFDFSKYRWYNYLAYFVSVLVQEFVSRGLIHEQCRNIIVSGHKEAAAIFLSSVFFGAAHFHLGLIYMISASVLLSVLGIIYRKQGTIFGLCIPHYILGLFLGILGFVVE